MKTYLIGYDLRKTGQDYQNLYDAIKALSGTWWHCLDSTWIIKSNSSAFNICEYLKAHIDNNDKLLVTQIADDAAWIGFDQKCSDWLKQNISLV
ncbi:SinR family protein [Rufibacter sp. LB8]|uniref:SinR family protein n=1 Tax=Rufibacter sp. LB8 TaxID=2777781 RepID=UPI00178C2112|nr:SinR family protein [Rufibacter sp. LB8]